MPAMCPLMTRPINWMSAPWCPRWTGVMTMTETIAVWDTATVTSASRAIGAARTAATPARSDRFAAVSVPSGAKALAVSSGSGRSSTATRDPVSRKMTKAQANGPAVSGTTVPRNTALAGAAMLGPSTEPIVVAQMTWEIARPRRSGSARSAAANRAWRLADEPAPNPAMPSSSRGKLPTTEAVTTRRAPSAPVR